MGTVPTLDTFTTGIPVTAPQLNKNARDAVNYLLAPPRASISRSTSWSVTSGATPQLLTIWDQQIIDTDNMWVPTPNPSRITANTPGLYEISLYVHYTNSAASGLAHCGIAINNEGGGWTTGPGFRLGEDTRPMTTTASFQTTTSIILEQFLNVGDYVEFYTAQTTAGTLTMSAGTFGALATARWVAAA